MTNFVPIKWRVPIGNPALRAAWSFSLIKWRKAEKRCAERQGRLSFDPMIGSPAGSLHL